jgi:hypothetical protein
MISAESPAVDDHSARGKILQTAAFSGNDQRGSAGITRKARSNARGRPSGCTSSRTTAMRLSSCPKLPPASQDSTVDSTKKTVQDHPRPPATAGEHSGAEETNRD